VPTRASDLLKWVAPLVVSRPRILLTHGEDAPRKDLAAAIQQRFSLTSQLPSQGDVIEVSGFLTASQALAS
jgi:metallo-beta-lactamase family protein